tara:strand:- start:45 stop:590 length:546 start_codon:yes stop_codon:yes gene_type:complete
MKKILLLFIVNILLQFYSVAQVELKTNVLGALLDRPYFAVEYSFTNDLSMELGAGAIFGKTINGRPRSGTNLLLAGKYYFNTRWGMDRYFLGLYVRPQMLMIKNYEEDNFDNASRQSGVGTGVIFGRKWAGERVSFEINMGLGKLFGDKIYLYPNPTNILIGDIEADVIFNINVGYRFLEN